MRLMHMHKCTCTGAHIHTRTRAHTEQITLLKTWRLLNTKWQSFFFKWKYLLLWFSSVPCTPPSPRNVDVGRTKRSSSHWPYKSVYAEVPIPTALLFSPVAASHVTIHPIGTIAGAAATGAFCAGGYIFFLWAALHITAIIFRHLGGMGPKVG